MAQEQQGDKKRRRWWGVAIAAAALLTVSQVIWHWQTWPVRDLLEFDARVGKAVR